MKPVASYCRAQGLVGDTEDEKAERNLPVKSEKKKKKTFPRPASVLSPTLGSAAMLKSDKVCSFGEQAADWGSRANTQEKRGHRSQHAVSAVLHAEAVFSVCMCPKWTDSETPEVRLRGPKTLPGTGLG